MSRATVVPWIKDVWHDGKRFHVIGGLYFTPGDYATEVAVDDLIAVSNEYRNVASITDAQNLEAGAATSNNAIDLAPKRIDSTLLRNLTGSIDAPGGSNTVTGVGTKFLTELKPGDYLLLGTATAGEIRLIDTIASDLSCHSTTQFSNLANDAAPQAIAAAGLLPINGTIDPIADPTVTGVKTNFLGYGLQFNLSKDGGLYGGKTLNFQGAPISMSIGGRNGYVYKIIRRRYQKILTGTVDAAAQQAQVGVGTLFKSELKLGDRWVLGVTGAGEERTIIEITDNTNLKVTPVHTDLANDTHPCVLYDKGIVDDLLLQIWGLYTVGGGGAVGTGALAWAASGGAFTKEAATNVAGRLVQHPTAALDASVLADELDFHAIFKLVGSV